MKVIIIGFGHAGQAYLSACASLWTLHQVTLVDLDPAVEVKVPEGVRFSTEVPDEYFDLAIVATPPATHFAVVEAIYERTERCILEKPFALHKEELDAIFELAGRGKIFFSIHALYGEELSLARHKIDSESYGKKTVVAQLFCDPYWPDGPKNLGGPFWDSIYNALGILNTLFDDVSLSNIKIKSNSNDLFDVICQGNTRQGDLSYRLSVDWGRAINIKVSEITDVDRKKGLLINHSQQCISNLSGLSFEYRTFGKPRLASHYQLVVAECVAMEDLTDNLAIARMVSEQVVQIYDQTERMLGKL